jgi:hypothetical protein
MSKMIYFLLLTAPLTAYSQTITVGDGGDYPTLSATQAILQAGDTALLLDQIFDDGTQFLSNLQGTETDPIVIMTQPGASPIFQGGSEAIHLINCNYVELNGITVEQQTSNGINIDDGGDYSTPTTHITIRNCHFRNMGASGNRDFLKLSGLDYFLIEHCTFTSGSSGGSGIDMVGCHWGTIQDCELDEAGISGIQAKGGTRFITIRRNRLSNHSQRALNLGGSTGLQFFRPPLPDPIVDAYEASDINVFANVFIDNWAPIAYVGSTNVVVRNNTFYTPENWVIRILQENTASGFLPCQNNEFSNNIIYLASDLTEVNVGPNTLPETFTFSHNLWYNASSNNWTPQLPAPPTAQLIGDPQFNDAATEDFSLMMSSPAIGSGNAFGEPTDDFLELSYASPPSRGAYAAGTMTGLPVEWLAFDLRTDESAVQLYWKTSAEKQHAGFEIQRKSDQSAAFEALSRLNASASGQSENTYTYLDRAVRPGMTYYYRIKQQDFSGEVSYSMVRTARLKAEAANWQVYPNPVKSMLNLQYSGLKGDGKISLYSIDGQLLEQILIDTNSGSLMLDLSNYPAGMYYLELLSSRKALLQRIVKH